MDSGNIIKEYSEKIRYEQSTERTVVDKQNRSAPLLQPLISNAVLLFKFSLFSFLFSDMEVTRPYTFSYFPNIIDKKKKDGNSESKKKKSRKISKVEIKTSLS